MFKLEFSGGPRDGDEVHSELLPEVIDGNSYHFYGPESYVLIGVDADKKIAMYEHMKLVYNEGGIGESDGVQPPDS